MKEFIALAKGKPREFNMASSGPGSASHLGGELFMSMAGIQLTHVPYKGTGGAMPDLVMTACSSIAAVISRLGWLAASVYI